MEDVAEPEGPFWGVLKAIGDSFDIIGACVCDVFPLIVVGSIVVRTQTLEAEDGTDRPKATLDFWGVRT
jgi:hypothetical protein